MALVLNNDTFGYAMQAPPIEESATPCAKCIGRGLEMPSMADFMHIRRPAAMNCNQRVAVKNRSKLRGRGRAKALQVAAEKFSLEFSSTPQTSNSTLPQPGGLNIGFTPTAADSSHYTDDFKENIRCFPSQSNGHFNVEGKNLCGSLNDYSINSCSSPNDYSLSTNNEQGHSSTLHTFQQTNNGKWESSMLETSRSQDKSLEIVRSYPKLEPKIQSRPFTADFFKSDKSALARSEETNKKFEEFCRARLSTVQKTSHISKGFQYCMDDNENRNKPNVPELKRSKSSGNLLSVDDIDATGKSDFDRLCDAMKTDEMRNNSAAATKNYVKSPKAEEVKMLVNNLKKAAEKWSDYESEHADDKLILSGSDQQLANNNNNNSFSCSADRFTPREEPIRIPDWPDDMPVKQLSREEIFFGFNKDNETQSYDDVFDFEDSLCSSNPRDVFACSGNYLRDSNFKGFGSRNGSHVPSIKSKEHFPGLGENNAQTSKEDSQVNSCWGNAVNFVSSNKQMKSNANNFKNNPSTVDSSSSNLRKRSTVKSKKLVAMNSTIKSEDKIEPSSVKVGAVPKSFASVVKKDSVTVTKQITPSDSVTVAKQTTPARPKTPNKSGKKNTKDYLLGIDFLPHGCETHTLQDYLETFGNVISFKMLPGKNYDAARVTLRTSEADCDWAVACLNDCDSLFPAQEKPLKITKILNIFGN